MKKLLDKYKTENTKTKTVFGIEPMNTISMEGPFSKMFEWWKKRKEEKDAKKEAIRKLMTTISEDFEKFTNIVANYCGKQNLTVEYDHSDYELFLYGKNKFNSFFFEIYYVGDDSNRVFEKIKGNKDVEYGSIGGRQFIAYSISESINFTNTKLEKIIEYLNDEEKYDLEDDLLEPGIKLLSNQVEPKYFMVFSYDATNITIKLNRQDRGYGSSIGLAVNNIDATNITKAIKLLQEDSVVDFDKMKYKSWFRS